MAESIIGLFKTEVIQRNGPWRHLEAVEFATLEWVDWFNTRRLLEPIGYVRRQNTKSATMPGSQSPDSHQLPSEIPGAGHSPVRRVRKRVCGRTTQRQGPVKGRRARTFVA